MFPSQDLLGKRAWELHRAHNPRQLQFPAIARNPETDDGVSRTTLCARHYGGQGRRRRTILTHIKGYVPLDSALGNVCVRPNHVRRFDLCLRAEIMHRMRVKTQTTPTANLVSLRTCKHQQSTATIHATRRLSLYAVCCRARARVCVFVRLTWV